MPSGPLFIGSWADVEVEIAPLSGLTSEDLVFETTDGPLTGLISRSRGEGWTELTPHVRLLAGVAPGGPYKLEVRHAQTDALLAEEKFSVTNQWSEADLGPGRWVGIGEPVAQPGPATLTSPQNLDVFPTSGTRKALVVFVETATGSPPLTFAAQFPEEEPEDPTFVDFRDA